MRMDSICPHCRRYIVRYGDGQGKFRYFVRKVYKDLWRQSIGVYPLGRFYKMKCPVCHRHLAVFEDITDEELRQRGPFVCYLCTLSDKPFDIERCNQVKSCHLCGVLKEMREAGNTLWYKKPQNLQTTT